MLREAGSEAEGGCGRECDFQVGLLLVFFSFSSTNPVLKIRKNVRIQKLIFGGKGSKEPGPDLRRFSLCALRCFTNAERQKGTCEMYCLNMAKNIEAN